jgi:thiamine-phosphate pyrophosphorylase
MQKEFRLPRIYPITDQHLSSLSHSQQVALLAQAGATLIQLRDKTSSPSEFFREAAKALTVARRFGVQIIINDRVDIALALSADGVHLGQNDMPPEAARRLLGKKALIGFSTHTLHQALAGIQQPVDYIAFGPIFPTSSKNDSDPVVGLKRLAKVRNVVKMPLVAIGGITEKNAAAVFQAGADSIALISAMLANSKAIKRQVKTFLLSASF